MADLSRVVGRCPSVLLAYLYGSQARGEAGPSSDVDVAVLLGETDDVAAATAELRHALVVATGSSRVDLVLLNEVPVELAYTVIAEGLLLYQRDVFTRVEYEADVLSRYADYLPVLRAQREEVLGERDRATRVDWYRAALGRTERTLGEIDAAAREGTDGV